MGWWNNKGRRDPVGKLAPVGSKPEEARRLLPVFRHHPCDRCGVSTIDGGTIAHAKYEITTPAGPLYLCGHHYDDHRYRLLALGYEVKSHDGAGT